MIRPLFLVALLGLTSAVFAADGVLSFDSREHVVASSFANADTGTPVAVDYENIIPEAEPDGVRITHADHGQYNDVGYALTPQFECNCDDCSTCDSGRCDDDCCSTWSQSAFRFGWWAVSNDGSPRKTGEFQDLKSSPFWDVDVISSDGVRTWDIVMTGLDNEANNAHAKLFGPHLTADVQFQRYLRRWDHDPLTGYDLTNPVPPTANDNVVSEDLNVGEDYAIRVQELDARFKGRLTDHVKWRVNVWGQRKFGERQANAVAHCFSVGGAAGNTCHILSQQQRIDWVTMEVEPAIEAQFENVNIEYSRTMRGFSQDDEAVFRNYDHFDFNEPYQYAIVPDIFTQIDRLRMSAQLNDCNHFYGNVYHGDTENKFRDTHREFIGFDVRLVNTSMCGVKLVGYANLHDEDNELPSTFLNAPPLSPPTGYDEASLRHPVDYNRLRAGVKGTWTPYESGAYGHGVWDGVSIVAGYEYYQLARDFATYDINPTPFTQPDTITHRIEIGPRKRWSPCFESYARYKASFIHVPLIGVSEYSADDPDVNAAFNSSLPEQEHRLELGGTWIPAPHFMATAQFSVVNSWHESQYADFTESDYPLMVSLWYAPNCRLSLTGAYGYFSNVIDQDITLGAFRGDVTETERTRWAYEGESHLATINATYAYSDCVQYVCGYEWVRGSNVFSVPTSPHEADGVDWSLLPLLSDVVVETHRVTAGVDWQPRCNLNTYVRYILFDYDDISSGLDSGTAHMALAGFTLIH